jgi:hypothetical protein
MGRRLAHRSRPAPGQVAPSAWAWHRAGPCRTGPRVNAASTSARKAAMSGPAAGSPRGGVGVVTASTGMLRQRGRGCAGLPARWGWGLLPRRRQPAAGVVEPPGPLPPASHPRSVPVPSALRPGYHSPSTGVSSARVMAAGAAGWVASSSSTGERSRVERRQTEQVIGQREEPWRGPRTATRPNCPSPAPARWLDFSARQRASPVPIRGLAGRTYHSAPRHSSGSKSGLRRSPRRSSSRRRKARSLR